ncbi:tRNA 2-thiouridine(34) synthase MnmA [Candidatus Woesebacteria bacterium]|nr:tRNA 2-thiouridine(34) synthase MnmA [Candidatus Woesebacteria bacterium]MCD8526662.1 tRNA 2-thiouridine(34) synthase MnmA [Candidatus Woesebacteria bacterium]MCD8546687.1 tRNA 2-thiouridine(34) synthase MnmA [Candidatus Woesebacteria bacterium]
MKVAVGLSGGVDSSVSAHRLVEAGHEVTGVFLECWRAPGCRAEEDRKDALNVALELGIPFQVLDFKQAYRDRVVEIFFEDYKRGLTPNPDIWCNTEIKFGLFYDWAMENGFDAIATGHYAQIYEKNGRKVLARGKDRKKDQTIFLHRLTQEQLDHVLFPIGDLEKGEVRAEAHERGIIVADKPDSQGICFIGDIDVRDFLRERLGEKPGDVLDTEGNIVGRHQGVWFYTIGQRHGFELFPKIHTARKEWKHVLPPLYVISKDADANTITVGYGAETLENEVLVRDVFLRDPDVAARLRQQDSFAVAVRIRHGGKTLAGTFGWEERDESTAKITLEEAQRGVAPGQALVLYDAEDAEVCLGGAYIC